MVTNVNNGKLNDFMVTSLPKIAGNEIYTSYVTVTIWKLCTNEKSK